MNLSLFSVGVLAGIPLGATSAAYLLWLYEMAFAQALGVLL